jgi:DnaK suppressor protein
LAKKPTTKRAKKKTPKKAATRRPKAVAEKHASAKKTARRGAGRAAKGGRASAVGRRRSKTPSKAARTSSIRKSIEAGGTRSGPSGTDLAPNVAATSIAEPAALTRPARALSRSECEPFRRLLLEKRAQLVGDVSTLQSEALSRNRQDAAGDLSNMPIHMADLGTDNYEQEFTLGLIEGERRVLREIDEALERIELGTYGICQATGKPISKARLKAQPWARYCYEYMLAQEKGQKGRS